MSALHRWHRNPWAHFRCAQCFIARWQYVGERLDSPAQRIEIVPLEPKTRAAFGRGRQT